VASQSRDDRAGAISSEDGGSLDATRLIRRSQLDKPVTPRPSRNAAGTSPFWMFLAIGRLA
ncbi:MAG TPA: hypothetical protein VKA15_06370, partial [Isosphaeraceae bacterium]|nr:hypothetical protein [Isosphaeraceae bacterium]